MEYYLYLNGRAFSATVHDSAADALAQLKQHRQEHPEMTWFMEDEDSREVA